MKNFIKSAKFWKSKMAANNFDADSAFWLQFQLCISRRNWNYKISSQVQYFENPRWRRPPSWIHQNVNDFCMDWAICLQFELYIHRLNRNGKISSRVWNLKISRWWRPPSWIYQNVNNFCMDWAFWLQFELHMPRHNRNWIFHQNCEIFKIQDGGGRHLEFAKM